MYLGQKINQAKIIDVFEHRDILVEVNGTKALIKRRFISSILNPKRGDYINDLVVVGFSEKGPLLAMQNSDYKKYLVNLFKNLEAIKEHLDTIYDRWRDDCDGNFKNKFNIQELMENLNFNRHIALIENNEYILPIFGSHLFEFVTGETKFYPQRYTLHQTYKVDSKMIDFHFPIKYSSTLYLNNSKFKYIDIFLHSFLFPSKWHFGVWKHFVGFDRRSIFSYCKINSENSDCDIKKCEENNLYKKIHPKIADDCYEYLKKIVTFFTSAKTNKIGVYIKERFINIYCYMEGFMKDSYNDKRYVLVLYGTCWNFSNTKPTFHLNPVTFYIKDTNEFNFKDKQEKFGKLIFTGHLGDIKLC